MVSYLVLTVIACLSSQCLGGSQEAALPAVSSDGTLNVGILIMPGFFISEATIPFDVYAHVAEMNAYFVAETMEPVPTAFGTRLKPHYTFDTAPAVDILVVPSGRGSHHTFLTSWYDGYKDASGKIIGKTSKGAPVPYYGNQSALISWVSSAASNAKLVTSHCWGAFTLADAGLLDGQTATTFPGYTETLDAHYPAIKSVVDDQRFVISGKVMTSNGGLACFEACLYVVRHIYGDEKATAVGPTGLVYSKDNIAHSKLEYYKVSPAKGTKPDPYGPFDQVSVGVLLLDGNFISEPVGPWDVFAHGITNMNAFFISPDMEPKTSYYGATLYPDKTFSDNPTIDILVVPSGIGSHWSLMSQFYGGVMGADGIMRGSTKNGVSVPYYGNITSIIDFVKTASSKASWVTSHCWGAFTLADAGVLDGKVATTFPGYGETLAKHYPLIKTVDDTQRIVHDGKVITSNGGVVAYEAPNYVLKLLYGDWEAKNLASGLAYAEDNYDIVNKVQDETGGSATDDGGADTSGTAITCINAMIVAVGFWSFFV